MPNTLAHLGIGGTATRLVISKADLKWIYLGCVIPDLPWIFQRLGNVVIPDVNLYDLRLYVIVQSTLLFSIILSLSLASFSKEYFKTFLILAFGCLIHLLLDPFQKKWANGTQLFAPFSWEMLNFDLFWSESFPTYFITLFGLFYFIMTFKEGIVAPLNLDLKRFNRRLIFIGVILIYFLVPLFILDQPFDSDNHFVKTLKNVKERSGKYFEIDRRAYRYENGIGILNTFAEEDIILKGMNLKSKETLSIRAKFIDEHTAEVIEYHVHSVLFRDGASYTGLAMIFIFWTASFYTNRNKNIS